MQTNPLLGRRLIPALVLLLALGILGAGSVQGQSAAPPPPGKPPHPLPPGQRPATPRPAPASQDLPGQSRSSVLQPGAPLRAGGPDAFGYLVSDSNEPHGPVFNYVAAPTLVMTGDDVLTVVALPFPITIYDRTSPTVTVNTNGLVYLGVCDNATFPCSNNYSLPDPDAPAGTIAAFWDDLVLIDPSAGVYKGEFGSAPTRTFVIEWRNAVFYDDPSSGATFEMVFHENSNEIDFEYSSVHGTLGNGSHAVVGMENYAGTIGLEYSDYEGILAANLAVRFLFLTSPGDRGLVAAPCSTVTYTGFVSNPYTDTVTFQLGVQDSDPAFGSVVTPTTRTLVPGGSGSYTVGQTVPATVPITETNVTTLTVASTHANFPLSETVHLTTQVQAPLAEFVPGTLNGAGQAGNTVTYTLSFYNRIGPTADFHISGAGNNWTTSIVPTDTGTLVAGAGISVTVRVMIPAGSPLGESDTLTLTAQAQLSGACAFSGMATITTFNNNQVGRSLLPEPRARHALVDFVPNGRLYLLGGVTTGNNRAVRIEEYDPRADIWTGRNTLPRLVSNVGAAALGDTIYVAGGFDGSHVVNVVQTYRPASDAVAILASDPLPALRQGVGMVALGGKIYVIGGADDTAVVQTVYEFDPARPAGARWVRKADLPTPRAFPAVAAVNGRIYVAGGIDSINDPHDLATVEIFNPGANSWTSGPNLLSARGGATAVGLDTGQPCGGYLYVFGGGFQNPLATAERLASGGTAWSFVAPLSVPRRTLAASYASNGHLLLITGGFNEVELPAVDAVGCGGTLPTATPTPPGGAPTFTPTPVCAPSFSDVHPQDYFYAPVTYLACHGVISGYGDGTFRPFANMTRAQLSKVVVLSQGWPLQTPVTPHFSDVPASHPFYAVIETAYSYGVLSGYADGTFRPYANVTRGQIAKIVVLAEGWPLLNPPNGDFSDVPPGSAFYQYVETAFNRGIISGYGDGTFRPFNPATRGQVSKIVYLGLGAPP